MKIHNIDLSKQSGKIHHELMTSKWEYNWQHNIFKLHEEQNPTIKYYIDSILDNVSYKNPNDIFILGMNYGQEYIHRLEEGVTRLLCHPFDTKWMINWGGQLTFHNNDKLITNDVYASNENSIKSITQISNSIVSFDSNIICYEHVLTKYFPFLKFTLVIDFIDDK